MGGEPSRAGERRPEDEAGHMQAVSVHASEDWFTFPKGTLDPVWLTD